MIAGRCYKTVKTRSTARVSTKSVETWEVTGMLQNFLNPDFVESLKFQQNVLKYQQNVLKYQQFLLNVRQVSTVFNTYETSFNSFQQ